MVDKCPAQPSIQIIFQLQDTYLSGANLLARKLTGRVLGTVSMTCSVVILQVLSSGVPTYLLLISVQNGLPNSVELCWDTSDRIVTRCIINQLIVSQID